LRPERERVGVPGAATDETPARATWRTPRGVMGATHNTGASMIVVQVTDRTFRFVLGWLAEVWTGQAQVEPQDTLFRCLDVAPKLFTEEPLR